eukprot:TRINITY_DN13584_c0_g2_i1.p2 TRINITY_DN13584_c0_g2~~TRINITY_DN13584_c0_g2_i1.p2  ORF type:complete len:106 (+),score=24.03 TRINITY_DN13584_c0_g2_i1:100-417(+)
MDAELRYRCREEHATRREAHRLLVAAQEESKLLAAELHLLSSQVQGVSDGTPADACVPCASDVSDVSCAEREIAALERAEARLQDKAAAIDASLGEVNRAIRRAS